MNDAPETIANLEAERDSLLGQVRETREALDAGYSIETNEMLLECLTRRLEWLEATLAGLGVSEC